MKYFAESSFVKNGGTAFLIAIPIKDKKGGYDFEDAEHCTLFVRGK